MKTYTQEELKNILHAHKLWLEDSGQDGAKRADLSYINLRGSNLRGSNLRGSDLSYSNLSNSDLSYSDLSYSDLSGSNLRGSNLRNSDLSNSDLSYSDLRGSDLSGSNLSGVRGVLHASVCWNDHGECGRQVYVHFQPEKMPAPVYQCGCFIGSLDELRAYIEHGAAALKASRTIAADFLAARMAEMVAVRTTGGAA